MNNPNIVQQIAEAASVFQQRRTGHQPGNVTAVMSKNTLVITLLGALTPAEQKLASTPEGAARVQEYHRHLFASSSADLRREIRRITGLEVKTSAAEVEPDSVSVAHAFTSGTMLQIFQFHPRMVRKGKDADKP